jgi:hypothetical protein
MSSPSIAERLYPNAFPHDWSYVSDYSPIINHLGYASIVTNDYGRKGDTFVLYRARVGNHYHILVIGWGSCSGCDALQACNTYADIDALIEQLYNKRIYLDDYAALLAYVNSPARDFDHYAYNSTWPAFRAAIRALGPDA